MRLNTFLITLTIFCNLAAHAQVTPPQYEARYRSAVNDFKQARYTAVIEKLGPLTSANVKESFSPYAHYYYALSAYRLKRNREARQMLVQLQTRYPGWNRINEVYYLLGEIALETDQTADGLEQLAKIKDSAFAKDIQGLKQHHLAEIGDLPRLLNLQKQFPADRDIALAAIQFIEKAPNSSQIDRQYAVQLQKQFKFSSKEKEAVVESVPKNERSKNNEKGFVDVAVLLPFRLDEFSASKHRSNQFAYDYYLGLNMAVEQLASEGIKVNLWAYDVSNDQKSMENIVVNGNFQQSDLVIGPLYAGTFDVTAQFAERSGTTMLNPLSTDGSLLKSVSHVYLGHPSIQFQTEKAARYMKTQAAGPAAAIYYGGTSKDSAMASLYAEEWKRNGGKILSMVKIQPDRGWLESNIPSFETNKPGHVALFSSNNAAGSNLIEILNGRKLNATPLIATSTSFDTQQQLLSRYGSRLSLIEPDHVDREKEAIRTFQRNYWNKTSSFPSVYSYLGYDQLLFFTRMLAKHKDKVSSALRARRYGDEEYLLAGFDYTKSNENQITPVLKYNGSKWVPVDK